MLPHFARQSPRAGGVRRSLPGGLKLRRDLVQHLRLALQAFGLADDGQGAAGLGLAGLGQLGVVGAFEQLAARLRSAAPAAAGLKAGPLPLLLAAPPVRAGLAISTGARAAWTPLAIALLTGHGL